MLCKLWCTVLTVMASSLEIKQDFRSFSTQILQITHSIRNQKNELALSTPEDVSGNVEDSTPIRSSERWLTKVGCGTGWIPCMANKTCFPAYSLAIDGGVICNPIVSMYHWCVHAIEVSEMQARVRNQIVFWFKGEEKIFSSWPDLTRTSDFQGIVRCPMAGVIGPSNAGVKQYHHPDHHHQARWPNNAS